MPAYDFRCPKCGLEFEVSRPMSRATEPAPCPQDGTESERLFTKVAAFLGRGSGEESSSAAPPAFDDHGHGHSHGPGGHMH